jgi:hypothetical protein
MNGGRNIRPPSFPVGHKASAASRRGRIIVFRPWILRRQRRPGGLPEC